MAVLVASLGVELIVTWSLVWDQDNFSTRVELVTEVAMDRMDDEVEQYYQKLMKNKTEFKVNPFFEMTNLT